MLTTGAVLNRRCGTRTRDDLEGRVCSLLNIAYVIVIWAHVIMTYLSEVPVKIALRNALVEAEIEYRNTKEQDYIARVIRDALIVKAHRGGIHQRVISELVGNIGQPNVARTKAGFARRDVVPNGFLAPDDALEMAGVGPSAFMQAVREERLSPVKIGSGVLAFTPEQITAFRDSNTR